MYIDNDEFGGWMQKLYAKLEELCKDVRVLRNADRVLPEDDNLLDNQDLCLLFKVSIKTLDVYKRQIRGCWSVKELERQIASLYYERSGLSKNKEALSALVQQQATLLQPKDVINTPVTLEFLGLNERALVTENDLEQSILDNLQRFLLEMGHGFCFCLLYTSRCV